jgi:Raf kinase inhibitor-like YbhB/YbcL family protein
MALQVRSSAFSDGQPIPAKYTCDAGNVSPPLEWTGSPTTTKTFALICDDPDAPSGTFTHWVLYDIAAAATGLAENAPIGKDGASSMKRPGYVGPCPPPGGPHRYFFRVYALDVATLGRAGLTKDAVLAAMKGHIVAQGQLMGTYQRKG